MNDEIQSLPWDQIQHTRGEIPWSAMQAFADALATNRELVPQLIEIYDNAYNDFSDEAVCADFYVAGVFAMAAPHLDDEMRQEIGSLLIKRLVQAGKDDMDVSLEVLLGAAGTMGPVILPDVLDAIAAEPNTQGAWFFLWSLTLLAAKTDDPDLRSRVIQACADALGRADRGEIDVDEAGHAAMTMAALKATEYTELLQRLTDKANSSIWVDEYTRALGLLQGHPDLDIHPEMWDQPVEEWLTPRCRRASEPVDESEEAEEEYYEEDEYDEEASDPDEETASLIATTFIRSPVGMALPGDMRGQAYFIAESLVYESLRVLDCLPRTWDEPTLRKLLLEIIPGSLPADREILTKIVPVAEAMLYWFQFDGMLPTGEALIRTIHGWTDQIVAAGMDPKSRESDKPLVDEAAEAGLDPLAPEFARIFMEPKSTKPSEVSASQPPQQDAGPYEPPIPIVEHGPKIARNAPCPCGSGKKYKKCHGRE